MLRGSAHTAPVDAVVLCLGRTLGARDLYFPSSLGSLSVSLGTEPNLQGPLAAFSSPLFTKKDKNFPVICETTGGKAATPRKTFSISFLKSTACAVLKLMSAVIATAHVLFLSIKSLSVSTMLLECSFGKIKMTPLLSLYPVS